MRKYTNAILYFIGLTLLTALLCTDVTNGSDNKNNMQAIATPLPLSTYVQENLKTPVEFTKPLDSLGENQHKPPELAKQEELPIVSVPEAPTKDIQPKNMVDVYVVTSHLLNVRQQPDANSKIISVVAEGQALLVLEKTDNGWLKLKSDGFVCSEYTEYIGPKEESAIADFYMPTKKAEPKESEDKKKEVPEGRKLKMVASAYTISPEQTTNVKGITASGTKAQKNHTLSVDPRVIPLGSLVYIVSNISSVEGYYIAEDTGNSIKGNKLDVFMGWGGRGSADWERANQFGTKTVEAIVVREGKEKWPTKN